MDVPIPPPPPLSHFCFWRGSNIIAPAPIWRSSWNGSAMRPWRAVSVTSNPVSNMPSGSSRRSFMKPQSDLPDATSTTRPRMSVAWLYSQVVPGWSISGSLAEQGVVGFAVEEVRIAILGLDEALAEDAVREAGAVAHQVVHRYR